METNVVVRVLGALAHESPLVIFQVLAVAGSEE
jgi:hypothetical protein